MSVILRFAAPAVPLLFGGATAPCLAVILSERPVDGYREVAPSRRRLVTTRWQREHKIGRVKLVVAVLFTFRERRVLRLIVLAGLQHEYQVCRIERQAGSHPSPGVALPRSTFVTEMSRAQV